MYIWLAIDVNEQLCDLRDNILQLSKKLDSLNTALTLPLHISLRISFWVDDAVFENVLNRITEIYSKLRSFEVEVQEIEKCGNIVWLKIKENRELNSIHKKLVDIMQEEYKVCPHEFDKKFIYHTTLFTDDDISKVDRAYDILSKECFPSILLANKLIIGCSETGVAGDYQIIKSFEI